MVEEQPAKKGKKKWLILGVAAIGAVVDTLASGGVLPEVLVAVARLLRDLAVV